MHDLAREAGLAEQEVSHAVWGAELAGIAQTADHADAAKRYRSIAASRLLLTDLLLCPQSGGLEPNEVFPWWFEQYFSAVADACTPTAPPFQWSADAPRPIPLPTITQAPARYSALRNFDCVRRLLGPPADTQPPQPRGGAGQKRAAPAAVPPAKMAKVYQPQQEASDSAPQTGLPLWSVPSGQSLLPGCGGVPAAGARPGAGPPEADRAPVRRNGYDGGKRGVVLPGAMVYEAQDDHAPLGAPQRWPAPRRPTSPPDPAQRRDAAAGRGLAPRGREGFVSAAHQYDIELAKQGRTRGSEERGPEKRGLGARRGFLPPFRRDEAAKPKPEPKKEGQPDAKQIPECLLNEDGSVPDRLKNIDPCLLETVCNEVLTACEVSWDDVIGLDHAKSAVMEAIIWPLQRPDIFRGIRRPSKGLLLFGPPGTGKTMIGKAIASESASTFFNISASSLMSKWVGEGEKMVRALFAVAAVRQPSVVFIDEIDSLLTARSDGEQDHTRRLKTEFLVQLDGAGTSSEDRILIVGATNRPEELDEAARRRMEKRLYIALPCFEARVALITHLLTTKEVNHSLSGDDVQKVARKAEGFSGADLTLLCKEASMCPLRAGGVAMITLEKSDVRPVKLHDFRTAFRTVKATVSAGDIERHEQFNKQFGCFGNQQDAADQAADEEDDDDFFGR
eukprot:TRINITY_DN44451_c0_g1_i1.p1 TRINITY_DN44451_c0_g1~~TRINITY_DN44451_c0_g1_i1.p1  ORF type:complete len:676 (+),score=182.34 TRINITY_DN44451_c0_g1_i1:55-2082(+)